MQRSGGILYQFFSLGGDRKDKDLVTFGFLKFICILWIYAALSRFRLQVQNKGEGLDASHFSFQYVTSSFFFCLASQNIACKGII